MLRLIVVTAALIGSAVGLSVGTPAASASLAAPVVLRRPLEIAINVDGTPAMLNIAVEDNPTEVAASFLAQHGCARVLPRTKAAHTGHERSHTSRRGVAHCGPCFFFQAG